MGRFDPVYSPEQKAAVIAAQVDEHQKPSAVVQAASEGKLAGLPPFTLNRHTASSWASVERSQRRRQEWETKASGTIEQQLDASAELITAIANKKLRDLRGKRNLDANQLEEARKAAQCLREAKALHRGVSVTTGTAQRKAAEAKAEQAMRKAAPGTQGPQQAGSVAQMLDKLTSAEGTNSRKQGDESGRVLSPAA